MTTTHAPAPRHRHLIAAAVLALLLAAPATQAQHDHSQHMAAQQRAAAASGAAASGAAASGAAAAGAAASGAAAAGAGHAHHAMMAPDTRQPVAFPAPMKEHTLANMRDHLLALAQIQEALGRGAWDAAGQIAEQRLGMSSLHSHGAHEVAGFMPEGMQAAGTAMHRSASRFAVEAQNSSASGDARPALAALATVTQACVACHAGYKFK